MTLERRLERRGAQLVVTLATARAFRTAVLVAVSFLVAWQVTWGTGGTRGPFVHFFYVPVMITATRFGAGATLIVGAIAGLGAGPLMPLDVAAGTPQLAHNWLIRLGFFVLIGETVAILSGRSVLSFGEALALTRSRAELETGLKERQFRVVYQPLFDLATGRLVGVEALARWTHPTRGEVSPADFIATAERSGVCGAIDMYVLGEAAVQAALWRQQIPRDSAFSLAVNLSAQQLADVNLAGRIVAIISEAGLPPSSLHVEITESAVVADIELAIHRVRELRSLGMKVAIDDFGTGQSSLAYLHHFHADIIKLDRSFVRASEQTRMKALAVAVVGLAADLSASTVAEGIETEEQADTMRELGFDVGQGFYYARPSDSDYIDRILPLVGAEPSARASW